jgi:hypothetical protein
MITRSRSKQMRMSETQVNQLVEMGLKYEEVQRQRKQNKWFSWAKFFLTSIVFTAACFASFKVTETTGTNLMASVYSFTERTKESFLTIPYKIPGYSTFFGADQWATPSMPWPILDSSIQSEHFLYEPNSTIRVILQEKRKAYDNTTELIYQILVQKTNYEQLMLNSQQYLYSLPQVLQLREEYIRQKQIVQSLKNQLCSTNILGTASCNQKQAIYVSANKTLQELSLLRSYTLNPQEFPRLFFQSSRFLSSFPRLSINASAFQSLLFERETLLSNFYYLDVQALFHTANRYTYQPIGSNSTLLQHLLNSQMSPLLSLFSRTLTYFYKQQSNLLLQIQTLEAAYTANLKERQYDEAIKDWDAFMSQCTQTYLPICSIADAHNRAYVRDIVYELRTNDLPVPENFQVLLQQILLNPLRFQNATARDVARVLRIEKYKKNPDPYTLLLSGSVGLLLFSGTYYVFFDRVRVILYALTMPFDLIISWGENWMKRKEFETQQYLLPDTPLEAAERTALIPKNTHKA